MLTHDSPVASANNLADYINAHVSGFPFSIQAKALEAVREVSPVVRLVKGMETLFAVVSLETQPDREGALNALGSAAMQVAEGGFWGKGDRAIKIMKFVRLELGEWPEGLDAPEAPELDPDYVAAPAPDPIPPTTPPEQPG